MSVLPPPPRESDAYSSAALRALSDARATGSRRPEGLPEARAATIAPRGLAHARATSSRRTERAPPRTRRGQPLAPTGLPDARAAALSPPSPNLRKVPSLSPSLNLPLRSALSFHSCKGSMFTVA